MKARIAVLGGDGIGPEVVGSAVRVLRALASRHGHEFDFEELLIGGAAIDSTGTALPEKTLWACQKADAILLGAVGGPKWDNPNAEVRPEQGLLALRKGLGLYANLRPVKPHPSVLDASPIRPERLRGTDLIVVRELTGGLYFGEPRLREKRNGVERAIDTMVYDEIEIGRVARLAFELARKRRRKVTSVDKANVLETSRLWRTVVTELKKEFADVELEHQLVDSCAMRLITSPSSFDVIVTENMFGDILTDEASVLAGSLGLLPSASLGAGKRGLYEPIHGSAPDIAGKGIANPVGTILSAAMMLRLSFGLGAEADQLEQAVDKALESGARTKDLGGSLDTVAMEQAILSHL